MDLTNRINILLVEDNDSEALFMLHTLQESLLPNTVHHVPTGEEALAFLNGDGKHNGTPRPDLILLDLNLPGLDGFGVLKLVKAHNEWKSIPIIIVTSSALEEDMHRIRRLEADHYLSKPFDLEGYSDLVQDIEEFWAAPRSAVSHATQHGSQSPAGLDQNGLGRPLPPPMTA